MKKFVVLVMCIAMITLSAMPIVSAVYPTSNQIENGTFDTDLSSWDVTESENFTITSDGGVCKFNTTDTDYYFDMNYTDFNNGTLYNLTAQAGDFTGLGSTGWLELDNSTSQLINNQFFNETGGNWTYTEDDETQNFIQGGYNETTNLSLPTSYAIESRKLVNETFLNETFTTTPNGLYAGAGSSRYIWNSTSGMMDCHFQRGTPNASYYYSTSPKDRFNELGIQAHFKSNTSGLQQTSSEARIGFFNTDNGTQTKNFVGIVVIKQSSSSWFMGGMRRDDGTFQYTNPISILNSNVEHGVSIDFGYFNSYLVLEVFNRTTLASHGFQSIFASNTFFYVNAIGVCNNDAFSPSSEVFNAHIDNLTAWQDITGIATSTAGYIEQNFTLSQNSTVDIELHRKHWHDVQNGYVRSSAEAYRSVYIDNETYDVAYDGEIYTNLTYDNITSIDVYTDGGSGGSWDKFAEGSDYELNYTTGMLDFTLLGGLEEDEVLSYFYNYTEHNVIYNASSTSPTSWSKESTSFTGSAGTYTLKLWAYHTITEGGVSFPAKATYWDDCYVNVTSYVENGTYVSDELDRGYFADWKQLEIVMNDYFIFDIVNGTTYVEAFTRTKINATASWSSWDQVDDFSIIVEFQPYDRLEGSIDSPNGQFIQYRLEVYTNDTAYTPRYDAGVLSSVPIEIAKDWGMIEQDVTKPYTDNAILQYDWRISELNNSKNGSFTVWVDNYVVEETNFTFFETSWTQRNYTLPDQFNASGTYTVKIRSYFEFNSTNGTGTVLLDNVRFLIEEQSPTIIDFNVTNGTTIQFNGTFTDYSRGSDYQYLGESGIVSVNISINGIVIPISDWSYIGNGTYEFDAQWDNTPFELSRDVVLNATLVVCDHTGLCDTNAGSLTLPTATNFLIGLLSFGLMVIIIMLIFQRHLMTEWDTNPKSKDEKILPSKITGGRNK